MRRAMTWAHFLVASYHAAEQYSAEELQRKVVLTSSITDESLKRLGDEGVHVVIDRTPQLLDRLVGLNVIDAMILASLEKPADQMSDDDYLDVLGGLHFAPRMLGAQIMGLGAFTKVVGDAGITVARRASIPITTGNSYSASGALWAAADAVRRMGLVPLGKGGKVRAKAMVIGATGATGSACARLLAQVAEEVVLQAGSQARHAAGGDLGRQRRVQRRGHRPRPRAGTGRPGREWIGRPASAGGHRSREPAARVSSESTVNSRQLTVVSQRNYPLSTIHYPLPRRLSMRRGAFSVVIALLLYARK